MTDRSRELILRKRDNPVNDFSNLTLENGDLDIDQIEREGLYKINATHQIGIATDTEVGLPMARYPIRVLIKDGNGQHRRASATIDTVCHVWSIKNAANETLPFQRSPFTSDLAIVNLYTWVPDLDERLWKFYDDMKAMDGNMLHDLDRDLDEDTEAIYNGLIMANAPEEVKADVIARINKVIEACLAVKRVAYIKIDANYYIKAQPHGTAFRAGGGMTADRVAISEALVTAMVNKINLSALHETTPEGVITMASLAVSSMFRYGLFEAYESREFVTMIVIPDAVDKKKFTVDSYICDPAYPIRDSLKVGTVIDVTEVRVTKKSIVNSLLFVWNSGLMHYLFNHTTGGSLMSGPLLTTAAMSNLVTKETNRETMTAITDCMYSALHPSNKRAIANIFFKKSLVTTHGRMRGCPQYEKFALDSFTNIRSNPYPAGSHKAFIASQAFTRVIDMNLAQFLPWYGRVDSFMALLRGVLQSGARAHMGSHYYTGKPASSQTSAIDEYMPELARFMHVFHAQDSLTASPHLSAEMASKANANWTATCKNVKSRDLSATDPELIKEYLKAVGVGATGLDPDDRTTWAIGAAETRRLKHEIVNLF